MLVNGDAFYGIYTSNLDFFVGTRATFELLTKSLKLP